MTKEQDRYRHIGFDDIGRTATMCAKVVIAGRLKTYSTTLNYWNPEAPDFPEYIIHGVLENHEGSTRRFHYHGSGYKDKPIGAALQISEVLKRVYENKSPVLIWGLVCSESGIAMQRAIECSDLEGALSLGDTYSNLSLVEAEEEAGKLTLDD